METPQAANVTALGAAASNASGLANTAFLLGSQVASHCITGANVGSVTTTGWGFNNQTGTYGTEYLLRARKATTFKLTMIGPVQCVC